MLIGELERGLLRGEETAGAELVLQELRRSARETGRPSQRIGSLARLFFQPLEPFLVDDAATHKHPGRIARVALEPIWEWISRDLLPGEAKSVSGEVSRAYAQALMVNRETLVACQDNNDAIMATETLKKAFRTDVEPILAMARLERGGAINPIGAYRASNYRAKVAAERPAVKSGGGGIV